MVRPPDTGYSPRSGIVTKTLHLSYPALTQRWSPVSTIGPLPTERSGARGPRAGASLRHLRLYRVLIHGLSRAADNPATKKRVWHAAAKI
jgi:hypothetical protein